MKLKFVLLFLIIYQVVIHTQSITDDSLSTADTLEYYTFIAWSDEYCLDELPSNILAEDNKLSLFVDYNDIDTAHSLIYVYLINKTPRKHYFRMRSISSVILPEYKINGEQWKRYVSFYYGMCGTPYVGHDEIDSLKFRKVICSYPTKGIKKLIRYRLYDYPTMVSNEGYGYVDTVEVQLNNYDDLSFEFSDLSFLTRIAYGEMQNEFELKHSRGLRYNAIYWITFLYDRDRAYEILSNLIENGDDFSKYALRFLNR